MSPRPLPIALCVALTLSMLRALPACEKPSAPCKPETVHVDDFAGCASPRQTVRYSADGRQVTCLCDAGAP